MLTEAEYNQKIEEEIEKEREIKKIENIATVKRSFENHEEIMAVVDKLPDEEKYYFLEFLVSHRKKERDEFDWEILKKTLIMREEALQRKKTKNNCSKLKN